MFSLSNSSGFSKDVIILGVDNTWKKKKFNNNKKVILILWKRRTDGLVILQ